jgi:hypothetical protein
MAELIWFLGECGQWVAGGPTFCLYKWANQTIPRDAMNLDTVCLVRKTRCSRYEFDPSYWVEKYRELYVVFKNAPPNVKVNKRNNWDLAEFFALGNGFLLSGGHFITMVHIITFLT